MNTKARSVTLKVKDKDIVGSDILGLFAVEVEELLEEEVIGGWYELIILKMSSRIYNGVHLFEFTPCYHS